ncbi:hypothetical protein FPZ42_07285 [Mucilaginibacter achroorhodeus]|uniref:Uncharacterized protein n=1 Tax=Mucilaginibacter achroorhodeus TaxID=2599294 RepID=A0A563U682_9SPHI|nr:hypothetical protein [Mucilaginibacter achroorhodeus]TWR26833.1 hypothetical protein FPZ42_07285 [Mucilaginibacter achroorhodeus]
MMTLLEFNALSLYDKANAVWHGTFLADRKEKGMVIQLYSLAGFYVEVFYDQRDNKIIDLRSFTSTQKLFPYLAQIKFI